MDVVAAAAAEDDDGGDGDNDGDNASVDDNDNDKRVEVDSVVSVVVASVVEGAYSVREPAAVKPSITTVDAGMLVKVARMLMKVYWKKADCTVVIGTPINREWVGTVG